MYDESDGKVLLIGSVDRPDLAGSDVESPASSSHGGPSASSTDSFSGTRGSRSIATVGRGEAAEAAAATRFGRNNASVKVFPDRNFRFSRDSNLVVLAETQTMAEDLIFNFEVDFRGGGVEGVTQWRRGGVCGGGGRGRRITPQQ